MSYVRRWSMLTKHLVFQPRFFFENFNVRESYGFPLAYVTVSAFVGSLLFAALLLGVSLFSGSPPATAVTAAGVFFALAFVLTLVGFLVRVLVSHGLVVALGGGEFTTTLEVFAYPTVVTMTTFPIPVLNLVGSLYGLYLQWNGLTTFHELSAVEAVVVLVVGAAVSAGLTFVVAFVVVPILVTLVGLAALAGVMAL